MIGSLFPDADDRIKLFLWGSSIDCVSVLRRIYTSTSDLWCWHRLDLPFLELRLRRQGRLPLVRQRGLQAPVREPGHHPQGRRLPPLRHHVVLPTQELQEVHQRSRGPHVAG